MVVEVDLREERWVSSCNWITVVDPFLYFYTIEYEKEYTMVMCWSKGR